MWKKLVNKHRISSKDTSNADESSASISSKPSNSSHNHNLTNNSETEAADEKEQEASMLSKSQKAMIYKSWMGPIRLKSSGSEEHRVR